MVLKGNQKDTTHFVEGFPYFETTPNGATPLEAKWV